MKETQTHFKKLLSYFFDTSSIKFLTKWTFMSSLVGVLSGCLSAFFLISLSKATSYRVTHPYMLFLLPIGGAFVSFFYKKYGENSLKGNNLILEQIQIGHQKNENVPLIMTPLVLFGTVVTHLFGGSAGREGTAVQMGGSMAELVGKIFKVDSMDRKILLLCGISSGFGSVFGTPLAGTVFAMEVVAIGEMQYFAFIPCFISSFVSNFVALALGATHSHYEMIQVPDMTFIVILKIIIASICFGLCSILFSELTSTFKYLFNKFFENPVYKSAFGGLIVIILVYAVGTKDYIGLGLPMISKSLTEPVSSFAFFWKTLFTSITLGSGFQGGEVTPLFYIGSTLGNALGPILNISPYFLASLGFVAVFSGATNTPLACFIMGLELFHGEGVIFLFIACMVSYLFSGHHGIYSSQKISTPKYPWISIDETESLSTIKQKSV
ncbi:voltage-gated chloride channel family protein [Tepidibacter aestuarii]|uniref:voltage-gated chloride channel family protein n=1 Tax=Tepidibacter aestuarii TaxID=2925782 RepID=UPI0020C0439E|nr:voltage-gated chloride channel family protein [Tepidibacter aestuarii]CAH2211933.1 Chloride/fluoride channel protein [Tepidibacter aestuarii]